MNVVPWFLRGLARWEKLKAHVNFYAQKEGWPTYDEAPKSYSFHGWGTVGFPPTVACNVTYLGGDAPVDIPDRITGYGF